MKEVFLKPAIRRKYQMPVVLRGRYLFDHTSRWAGNGQYPALIVSFDFNQRITTSARENMMLIEGIREELGRGSGE